MAERMLEVDYSTAEGLVVRLQPKRLKLLPKEARKHVRASGKEALLAFRSFLDSAIEYLEHSEKSEAPKKRAHIKVEGE